MTIAVEEGSRMFGTSMKKKDDVFVSYAKKKYHGWE